MTWAADVPFPAEDMGKCRGCDADIGWIQREKNDGSTKAHPVDPKGWHGQKIRFAEPRGVKGLTLNGVEERVVEPQGLFAAADTVVFTSHFLTCPDAAKFWKPKEPKS